MEWLEISVTVGNEVAEAVAEVLSRFAHRGVAIEAGPAGLEAGPVIVRAYLPADEDVSINRRRAEEALWHLGQICPIPPPAFRLVAEADWVEAWKEKLSVLHVGQHIVIRPSWLTYTPRSGDIVIQLDPGMAFGTGLHPTTQMCLETLEELVQPGAVVLDIGTGSGILAIAAARLKAGRVAAVDNDPTAVATAQENVGINGVQEVVHVRYGSLPDCCGDHDLVTVNIVARVIVDMLQAGLAARVRAGGYLIATGILTDQEDGVAAALEQEGFELAARQRRDDWVCLVARKGYSCSPDCTERLCR